MAHQLVLHYESRKHTVICRIKQKHQRIIDIESIFTVFYIVLKQLAGQGSRTAEPSFCLCHQLAGQPCASCHVKDETACSLIILVFLVFIFLIEVYFISNVVLVSSTQQSNSVKHAYIYIFLFIYFFFQTLFCHGFHCSLNSSTFV